MTEYKYLLGFSVLFHCELMVWQNKTSEDVTLENVMDIFTIL